MLQMQHDLDEATELYRHGEMELGNFLVILLQIEPMEFGSCDQTTHIGHHTDFFWKCK